MAILVIERQAGLTEFTDAVVNRPDVQAMIGRVEFDVHPEAEAAGGSREPRTLFMLDSDGIAHIEVSGPMMKGDSKFGGTNTVRTRRAIREAVADEHVRGLMIHIDSPGGTVAGTSDLASDVRRAGKEKPVFAHIDDIGASAAFWTASQAGQVSIGKTGEVGSIGAVAVVEDTSKAAEMSGVEVHVVSTGAFKGAFADGAPVLPAHLEMLQDRLDNVHDFFMRDIARGRRMPLDSVRKVADGRVFSAAKGAELGLVDKVASFDEAVSDLRKTIRPMRRDRASQRIRLAALTDAG